MISMNTKDWQANIEVRIFVIYMTEPVKTNMLYALVNRTQTHTKVKT